MPRGELLFGAATDPGQVSAALASRFQVRVAPPQRAQWTLLDTADWRLFRAGLIAREERRERSGWLHLISPDGDLSAGAPAPRWPRLADTLPASDVRDQLATISGPRALLPLARVDVSSTALALLDDEGKTRVRIQVDQQRLAGDRPAPLPLQVSIAPLRGYERDGARAADLLSGSLTALDAPGAAAEFTFRAAGLAPGQPAVADLHLDADEPAAVSLALALRHFMDVIDSARPGVLADIDVEYLHDMRTAIRATRSLLQLAGDTLPAAQAARFTGEFAWLGRLTTPLRDLDVSLLMLGGADTAGLADLEPMRRQLAARRRRALATLRDAAQSRRGSALGAQWRRALDRVGAGAATEPTTGAAAAAHAATAYRRIVAAARNVDHDTAPAELHRLRRRCKRMRYLLDGYASVYAAQPRASVLRSLKDLQDVLGEIQDADVQRRQLRELADSLNRHGSAASTLLAMGSVAERGRQRETAARRKLDRRLDKFCSGRMRKRVRELGTGPA